MKARKSYKLMSILFSCAVLTTPSFAKTTPIDKDDTATLEKLFFNSSNKDKVEITKTGLYVETQHCHPNAPKLSSLLHQQLNIQKDQELINLFEDMLCAPRDEDGNINLGHLSKSIQNPIPLSMSMYIGMSKLGGWSLKDAHHLSDMSANEASISALGLFLGGSRQTLSFWQVHSPSHIRIWQAPFRDSPSDAIIFEFKLINQEWKLVQLWMGSRI